MVYFIKEKFIAAIFCNKYGVEFVLNYPSTQFGNLFEWTRNHGKKEKPSVVDIFRELPKDEGSHSWIDSDELHCI